MPARYRIAAANQDQGTKQGSIYTAQVQLVTINLADLLVIKLVDTVHWAAAAKPVPRGRRRGMPVSTNAFRLLLKPG